MDLINKYDNPFEFLAAAMDAMKTGKLNLKKRGAANARELVRAWNKSKQKKISIPEAVQHITEYNYINEAWTADSVIKNAEIGSKKGYGINIKKGGGITKTPFKHMLLTMQKHKNVRVTFDHGKDVFEGTPQSVALHINQTLGIK